MKQLVSLKMDIHSLEIRGNCADFSEVLRKFLEKTPYYYNLFS